MLETEDHRCYVCKDKHRREADDSEGEALSDGDDEVEFINEIEVQEHPEKHLKLDVESRHYAYDIESMLISTTQPDGTTKDVNEVFLIIARRLYNNADDANSFHVFDDIGSFFKFALSNKRRYFWAHNAQGNDSRVLFSYVSHISTLYKDPRLFRTILTQNSTDYSKLLQKEYRGEIEMKEMVSLPVGQTMVQYAQNKEDDFQNKNVAVAAFVAAHGRLYLWETLHKLGDRVLYHVTDSILYEHSDEGMNVEIGYMLGDWENELDADDQIVIFVALGPKTYTYKTRKGKHALKCKGFTLNSANTLVVTHQQLIDLLPSNDSNVAEKFVNVSNREFNWDRETGEYWTWLRNKTLRFTADKNVLHLTSYTTKPFGHENFQ